MPSTISILSFIGGGREGHIEGIREYLQTAQSDMDAITPLRFCENETANLMLSFPENEKSRRMKMRFRTFILRLQ